MPHRTTIEVLTIKFRRVTRESTDDRPSLPPMKVARDTTGETISETTKPLARCVPLVRTLRRVG